MNDLSNIISFPTKIRSRYLQEDLSQGTENLNQDVLEALRNLLDVCEREEYALCIAFCPVARYPLDKTVIDNFEADKMSAIRILDEFGSCLSIAAQRRDRP